MAPVERDYQADRPRVHGAVWEHPGAAAPALALRYGIWDTLEA